MFDFNLQFARNGADLTVELFRVLSAGGVKENIVFSPFSVQSCVALAFAGAQGDTAEEIVNGLKLVSDLPQEVGETFQFVLEKYKESPLLKIANKIYVQEGHAIKPDFQTIANENFHAEAECLNFGENAEAAAQINGWVEQKTDGKIRNLIDASSLNSLTRLVLLNAMHFKGNWADKFNAEHTAEDDFWIADEESVKVTFMNKKAKFGYGYFDELGCTALEMPYKDSDLSMFVLLPNEREGLKTLAEKLKGVNLVDLADKMDNSEDVVVKFPKFKIDYSVELSEALRQLGLKLMFTPGKADFSNMLESSEDIFVSSVVHKACIEVNEEGTEAAAATGMVMMARMMLLPLQFVADRPFLYMIWNKKNVLFAGAFVNAPTA